MSELIVEIVVALGVPIAMYVLLRLVVHDIRTEKEQRWNSAAESEQTAKQALLASSSKLKAPVTLQADVQQWRILAFETWARNKTLASSSSFKAEARWSMPNEAEAGTAERKIGRGAYH